MICVFVLMCRLLWYVLWGWVGGVLVGEVVVIVDRLVYVLRILVGGNVE